MKAMMTGALVLALGCAPPSELFFSYVILDGEGQPVACSSVVNTLEVAFGRDSNGDGSLQESEFSVVLSDECNVQGLFRDYLEPFGADEDFNMMVVRVLSPFGELGRNTTAQPGLEVLEGVNSIPFEILVIKP